MKSDSRPKRITVGRGDSGVNSVPCVRKGSNPTPQPPRRDLRQVVYSRLPVALWRVNSDTVSVLLLGAPLSSSGLEEALLKYPEWMIELLLLLLFRFHSKSKKKLEYKTLNYCNTSSSRVHNTSQLNSFANGSGVQQAPTYSVYVGDNEFSNVDNLINTTDDSRASARLWSVHLIWKLRCSERKFCFRKTMNNISWIKMELDYMRDL